mmetsp:Transcript_61687/g.144706  ORF Transcript_61687/g.144706 Transcript_61687/m.144706 type:complete len:541 (+) Transcript_61687:64-1686(+)
MVNPTYMDRLRPSSACSDAIVKGPHPPQTLAPGGSSTSRYGKRYGRCGSPALAARHSRLAQEGRRACHQAVRQLEGSPEDLELCGNAATPPAPVAIAKGGSLVEEVPRWAQAVKQREDGQAASNLEATPRPEVNEETMLPEDDSPTSFQRPAPPHGSKSRSLANGRAVHLLQTAQKGNLPSPSAKDKAQGSCSESTSGQAATARGGRAGAMPPVLPGSTRASTASRPSPAALTPSPAAEAMTALSTSQPTNEGSTNPSAVFTTRPPAVDSQISGIDLQNEGPQFSVSSSPQRPDSPSTHASDDFGPSCSSGHTQGDEWVRADSWQSHTRSAPVDPPAKEPVSYSIFIPSLLDDPGGSSQAEPSLPSRTAQTQASSGGQAATWTSASPRRGKKGPPHPPSSPAPAKSPRKSSAELHIPKGEVSVASSRSASAAEEEVPISISGPATWSRFEHVKSRGRSQSPPPREIHESWRAGHVPPDCVIKRRRTKKGPKEKLLVLPFLALEADSRFSHLFDTLEAKQPEILSETVTNLRGLFSGVRVG